jgi:uncharacterized membrane protein YphA (DoxX/SURF4 family)
LNGSRIFPSYGTLKSFNVIPGRTLLSSIMEQSTQMIYVSNQIKIDSMKKHVIIEVISFLFILLFIYAAVSKMIDMEKFRAQLGQSPLLTAFAYHVAWIVPSVEIIIAIMLATAKYRIIAMYGSLNLMIMFTVYIVIATKFTPYVPCSCGGVLEKLGWNEHLIFNIVFVMLAVINIILYPCYERAQKQYQFNLKEE